MRTVRYVRSAREDAVPEDDHTIGSPVGVWIEWTEEYVPKGGRHKGKLIKATNGVSLPREVFLAAVADVTGRPA